jgi:hypothetical protein
VTQIKSMHFVSDGLGVFLASIGVGVFKCLGAVCLRYSRPNLATDENIYGIWVCLLFLLLLAVQRPRWHLTYSEGVKPTKFLNVCVK